MKIHKVTMRRVIPTEADDPWPPFVEVEVLEGPEEHPKGFSKRFHWPGIEGVPEEFFTEMADGLTKILNDEVGSAYVKDPSMGSSL